MFSNSYNKRKKKQMMKKCFFETLRKKEKRKKERKIYTEYRQRRENKIKVKVKGSLHLVFRKKRF